MRFWRKKIEGKKTGVALLILSLCLFSSGCTKQIRTPRQEPQPPPGPLNATLAVVSVPRLDPKRVPVRRIENLFKERASQIFGTVFAPEDWKEQNMEQAVLTYVEQAREHFELFRDPLFPLPGQRLRQSPAFDMFGEEHEIGYDILDIALDHATCQIHVEGFTGFTGAVFCGVDRVIMHRPDDDQRQAERQKNSQESFEQAQS